VIPERSSSAPAIRSGSAVASEEPGSMRAWCAFSLCWLGAAALSPAEEWGTFTSHKCRFQAEFPAKPVEQVKPVSTPLGEIPYTTHTAELHGGQVAFGVAFDDYADAVRQSDPEAALDRLRDEAHKQLGGEVKWEQRLTIDGRPAREFTILGEVQGQPLFYHTRVMLIDTRLYQLQVVRVGDAPVDIADVVRFFSSFTPLPPLAARQP